MLQSTGIAGNPRWEYFSNIVETLTAEDEQITSFPDYLQYVRSAAATENGVLGINVMWRQVPSALRRIRQTLSLDGVADDETFRRVLPGLDRFVFLHRVDHLDQAVSWARAHQSGQWRSYEEPRTTDPKYDFNMIDMCYYSAVADDYAWRTWFGRLGIQPLLVEYEQLTVDAAGVVGGILEYLGLDPASGRRPQSPLRKQADELSLEWKQRYLRDLKGWRVPSYGLAT